MVWLTSGSVVELHTIKNKTGEGLMKKLIVLVVALLCALSVSGCNSNEPDSNVPEDFYFSLTWGCYGISSYDSKTGKLVKTTDATHPDDYVTSYKLTNEDKEYIFSLIASLDVDSYPDIYDPHNGMVSSPSMTLILTVCVNGEEKTVKAEDICLSYQSKNEKGQKFLSVCEAIQDRLKSTAEWESLPEYEFYYD